MTADGWTRAVRDRLGAGRLLPLGGPRDGAWITEDAARAALRRTAGGVPGVRLGALRIAAADPEGAYEPVVPAPPSALPPGPLRVSAECAASGSEPLPTAAARLRAALAAAAERLGLVVAEVDLRVTELFDAGRPPVLPEPDRPTRTAAATAEGDESRAGGAALAVPGVTGLTEVLGRAVRIDDRPETTDTAAALPRRHVRVEVAVGADRRALDVARDVRAAVKAVLPDRPSVAVLVTGAG
ncbi:MULTISPECIES: nucleopolyhedrovirus P10 family protein [unclassified Streptomyces]|uniref:nucleopolyhedrovirus P10 family protein n=1 Tax=unclassified Streptomyces TaxID=2593676 RepID=UPI00382ADC36